MVRPLRISNTSAPRNVYRCRDDKYVALSGSTQNMALRFFKLIGPPEFADDPRFLRQQCARKKSG